jgi:nicotinamide mononucleotide transporter
VSLFSVDTVAFTVLGYPMSWIELVGTVTYLGSVWLMARRAISTWPVGIVSVLLYLALFWQVRLYSDALEQVYYLGASVYGWWRWSRGRVEGETKPRIRFSVRSAIAVQVVIVALGTLTLGSFVARAHLPAPALFPEAASFPYLDAGTTVASFVAMALLARGRAESWLWWIAVDVVGIGLYWVKDVRFVALLYVALLALAVRGLLEWRAAREG